MWGVCVCVSVCKFNCLYTQLLHLKGETSRFTCGTSESKEWSHQTAGSSLPFPQSKDGQRQECWLQSSLSVLKYFLFQGYDCLRQILGSIRQVKYNKNHIT